MARIPDHILDQVREAHDIVEVVRRSVALKQAGSGFKGLCPFHDEKTPSFTVHPGRQTWKCFGCGRGGNVFGFLMEIEGLAFPEVVRRLAEERGIALPEAGAADPQAEERFARIRAALAFAHRFFVKALGSEEGREARDYLERRGYDAEARKGFGLGYAPPAWDRLVQAATRVGVPARTLEEAGLAIPRREGDGAYDRFRHRVVFPIADARGRLCTFAGRALDPDEPAKYLNGPETDVFRKSNVLYAFHRARDAIRRKGEALLMEGYTDVLMCHLHGFEHAVAGMGTAFTARQAALLGRLAERVVLLYDGDEAGRMAAERALDVLLAEGLEVRVALLPEGRDVDEILLEEGSDALAAILADARELFDFKLGLLERRVDLSTPRGRALAAEDLLASVVHVKSPLERDQLLRLISERLGSGPETEAVLRREAARLLGRPRASGPAPEPARASPPAPEKTVDRSLAENDLLGAVLALPQLRGPVFRAVGPEEFTAPARERLYNALLARWEAGKTLTFESTIADFQADAEVAAILAGLPEDETLAERVGSWIEFTERRRSHLQHQREVARLARGGAGEVLDPDASWFGDAVEAAGGSGREESGADPAPVQEA